MVSRLPCLRAASRLVARREATVPLAAPRSAPARVPPSVLPPEGLQVLAQELRSAQALAQ